MTIMSKNELPDGTTCSETPKDQNHDLIRHGRRYRVSLHGSKPELVDVHEDPDTGDLCFRPVKSNDRWQLVDRSDPRVSWERE
jgi:hypothetical protein